MLCDSHIHIGQFYDFYTSPEDLNEYLKEVGVGALAVSSTTTCEGDYKKVIEEIRNFIEIFHGYVVPILWVTPELLNNDNLLISVLSCGINWKCIKVHPQLSPNEWDANSKNYEYVVSLAKSMNVPILIHTGVVKNCHPYQIAPLFINNKEQFFILAHGRPIEETICVMESCPNTFVDTAFMPTECIQKLVHRGFNHRILWGSDYPIIRYLERNLDYNKYYREQLLDLCEKVDDTTFEMITHMNFERLFGMK